MKNHLKRFWGLYCSCAVVLSLACVSIAGVLAWNYWPRNASQGQVIPPSTEGTTTVVDSHGGSAGSDQDENGEPGAMIRLSEGQAQPQEIVPLPVTDGEPLTEEELQRVLSRLPDIEAESGDQLDFNLPPDPVPPPRPGETISEPFPPAPEVPVPAPVASGPLEVLRYGPEGEIPIAPFINITFNQPMVPLTTIEDLAQEDVPVQVLPDLPGTWRWVGTQTLTFNYDSDLFDRLPMATEYRVTIPAGTQSATGGTLAEKVEFTFSTPPVQVVNTYPSGDSQPLEPIFFVAFDQRIDARSVLDTVTVTADGDLVETRLATEDEISENKRISRMVESHPQDRWLAFQAVAPLPKDANISITIGPGTPSAEGLLLSPSAQSYNFRTYAPLKIVDHGCSWWDECRPLTPLYIEFNNPIDAETYDASLLRVEPEIPGVMVDIFGDTINIRGATQGQTTYTVYVSGEIQDIFGQKLGDDKNLTFHVGPAEPVLVGPDETFITMDPSTKEPVLSLYTINYNKLDLQIYAVQPADWPAFKTYLQEYRRTDQPPAPPGRKVFDDDLRIEAPANKLTEVGIELNDYMDGDFGHFIVIAKPPKGFFEDDRYWETVQVWVQVTQIGLDTFVDHSEMVVWTSALQNGVPLSGIGIIDDAGAKLASTADDGTARFSIPGNGTTYLVASQGADQALLPNSAYAWGDEGWYSDSPNDYLRWYVFDDRQMYRPGEEVHLKGWIRLIGGKQDGDVGLPGSALSAVNYTIWGTQGNELGSGRVDVNALGGFDFAFTLPENANLGYAHIELHAESSLGADGQYHTHNFQIQEFRRPEFEVTARNESTGPYFVDGAATVAVEAAYYAGGPLPNAEVSWMVSTSDTNYSPPNWSDFTFGIWQPWWWYYSPYIEGDIYVEYGGDYQFFEGTTDATGNHYLNIDFGTPDEPRPQSVLAEATVMDVNRQAWAGSTSLMVHPAALYVGLRSDKYFVEKGEPLEIELIVTDLDGNPVVDRPIDVTAARLDWTFEGGRWSEVAVEPQTCTVGSQAEPVTCTFETPLGGKYQITALVNDEMGRPNKSQFTRWVSGGEQPPAREVEQETVTLIPDQESYQPGDTAKILVQSPFNPAEGLLTVSRSGILYTERFEITDGTATLEIPIKEAHLPNLNIQVDLVGEAPRLDDQGEPLPNVPPRPAYASGTLMLNIPPLLRTLDVEVTPRDTALEPGGETTVYVALKDAAGNPVANAELAVVVVDEAILALTNYQLTDPVSVFYTPRSSEVRSHYSRASIVLVDPLTLADTVANAQVAADSLRMDGEVMVEMEEDMGMEAPSAAPMEKEAGFFAADEAEAGGGEVSTTPISVRMDFNPLATFAPEVRTDANGEARVEVKVPDNLTRYRIMVVAVDEGGQKFGAAESNLTARLPLMVRPAAPRFLNFGDQFELPLVLQNQTDEAMAVEVVVQASNLELTAGQGQRVTVPAHDRIEVRFPAAAEMVGTARLQIAAVSGAYADAAEISLPVYTPATTEAFATYGVLDEGAVAQPVASPNDVFPQFGGLEIQTSSTALQALTDAVLYLVSYRFECSEQLASRILGVAALRDVLTAFKAEGLPSPEEMESAVNRDIERLQGMQNNDGGFPYWRRGRDSNPFNTIHVAHALQRAEQKGFDVPPDMQARVYYYLEDIESYYPDWYSTRTRNFLSSYALYVRHLMGYSDPDKARELLNDVGLENLQLEAVGWLWPVLLDDPDFVDEVEAIRRHVNNRVVETAGAANFTTGYDDQSYLLLQSDRRTDAILLDAMIGDDPESDLIPKLVNGLLSHRTRGRWGNTQENVFVLLALDRYFNTYEDQTPDFVARIWLGDTYAGEHVYEGYTTERRETLVPMTYLVDPAYGGGETQDLIISKEGPGRLYYRLGMSYAPTDLWLDPLEMGFVVQRVYEAVDDPEDVYRDEEGIWHIKAGARVRVRLTMVADNRRYHVALVDPLPAGLEIINPALAVSGSIPQDASSADTHRGWWWWGTWYEHQNMRDERAEAFTALLWDGVYEYTYVARATTPGKFVVPPAKAEEMYSPEVFGRSASDWVIVE